MDGRNEEEYMGKVRKGKIWAAERKNGRMGVKERDIVWGRISGGMGDGKGERMNEQINR